MDGNLLDSNPETFIVEGRWCVEALLESSLEVEKVYLSRESHQDLEELYPGRAGFEILTAAAFQTLGSERHHT